MSGQHGPAADRLALLLSTADVRGVRPLPQAEPVDAPHAAAQYAGRLHEQQANTRERENPDAAGELQLKIEDVEEFGWRLVAMEPRDELGYRVSCRWKGETETGRPGPYTADIDDGVKVSIRPPQEVGLLASRQVIKKW